MTDPELEFTQMLPPDSPTAAHDATTLRRLFVAGAAFLTPLHMTDAQNVYADFGTQEVAGTELEAENNSAETTTYGLTSQYVLLFNGCTIPNQNGTPTWYDPCPTDGSSNPSNPDIPSDSAPSLPSTPKNSDHDSIPDSVDNCDFVDNEDQANFDKDQDGNACDADIDNDYSSNVQEMTEGSNSLNTDTDEDLVVDGDPSERGDSNSNGILNVLESRIVDTDGDGTVKESDPDDGNVNIPVVRSDIDGDGFDDSSTCTDPALGCDTDPTNGPLGDSDKDSVLNKDDKEPNSPAGAKVDANGQKIIVTTTVATTVPTTEVATTTTVKPAVVVEAGGKSRDKNSYKGILLIAASAVGLTALVGILKRRHDSHVKPKQGAATV